MRESRQEVGVAELGGKIYVAGGFRQDRSTANTVEVYDPASDKWSFVAPMPVALHHPAAAAVEGKLYVIGGTSPGGAANANLEYDQQKNGWKAKAPMPTARSSPAAAVIDGKIFVAGGDPARRAFEVYDPKADKWTQLTPMPTPRDHLAAVAFGGKFYAVGGRPPLTLNALEVFDPATNRWSALAPMPTGRSGIAGAVVKDCLYVFGGEGNPSHPRGVFPQNEVYNPKTNSWERLAPMPTPRHGIGAAVIGNKIHIPGGADVQGYGLIAANEVFTVLEGKSCEK
jgi:N-acetylneuraminic acid mutarotase